MYHVTDARALDRIVEGGLRPSSDEHSEHVYLFDDIVAALGYAERYHLAPRLLDNGIAIHPTGRPVLLYVEGDGLELEADPMRPVLTNAWRTSDLIDPERLVASALLSYDGVSVTTSRPRRL